MPELPEVETVRQGLASELQNARLKRIELYRADLRYPFPEGFAEKFAGREIMAISRRAKYLIFDFGGAGFLGHLGMTGSYRTSPLVEERRKHDHFAMIFENFQTIYHDPRRFGAVDIFEGEAQDHAWLRKLGPEPLGNAFHVDALYAAIKNRKMPIKSALLNQEIVAGLGNIYVCEALWQAGISPMRIAQELTRKDCENLVVQIKDVLNRAIESGGSTLRDFRNLSGGTGYFQHKFHVYDQAGKPCTHECGGEIVRVVQAGRSSFYCPKCQKR